MITFLVLPFLSTEKRKTKTHWDLILWYIQRKIIRLIKWRKSTNLRYFWRVIANVQCSLWKLCYCSKFIWNCALSFLLLSGHYFVFDNQMILYFSGNAFSTQTSNVGYVNFMGSINNPCSLVHAKAVTVLFAAHIFATHQATR